MRRFLRPLDSSRAVDLIAIFAVLAAMLAANVEWVFTRPDWVDTWMYYGFFHHYNVSDYLAGNKKIARLPWILLGFAVNKLFTAETAALILHIGCFALGAFFVYILTREMFGRKAAVLTSLMYLTWVPMHGFGGWDYHNTFVPILYLAAYRLLISATSSNAAPLRRFFFFGVMYALAVHTNILCILLVPALILRGLHGVRSWTLPAENVRLWLSRSAAGFVLGAVSITVVLGAINAAFGRIFLFPAILVARSAVLVEHPDLNASEWQPWSNPWWIGDLHTPLFDSVLVLIIIAAILAFRRWSWRDVLASSSSCALAEFVISLAIFAVGQTQGQELLQPFYMGMPMALPLFVALAALIARTIRPDDAIETDPARTRAATLLVAFASLAFGIQFVAHIAIPIDLFDWRPAAWYNMPPMAVILFGFAVAAVLVHFGRNALAFVCLTLALGQSNVMWPPKAQDWISYRFHSDCAVNQALLASVGAADDVLFPMMRAGRQVVLWYRGDEYTGPSPDCRLATYQLGRPLFAMGYGAFVHYWDVETAAEMPAAVLSQLTPGRDVVEIISSDPHYISTVMRSMRRQNPTWHEIGESTIGDRGMKFDLHLVSADPPTRQQLDFHILPQNGAVVSAASGGEQAVALPRASWTYAATLEEQRPSSSSGTIVVTMRVTSGTAALGVLNRAGSAFLTREIIPIGPKPIDVYLRVPDWAAAGSVVLETAAGGGGGTAFISSVSAMP